MDDLLPEFVAETRETLQAIAGALVAWEACPADRELLDHIFRFVHTVKGSCGFLDLPRLLRLSHAAEDALAEVRSGERHPDQAFVSAVLAIVDRVGELTDAIETGQAVDDADETALIAALAAQAPAPVAAAEPAMRLPPVRAAARSVRLPIELLDRMMGSVSDMVLSRNELARNLGAIGDGGGGHASAFERLSLCVHELREAVTRARMARIDSLFSALPRLVRDLSAELGKQVRLVLDGGEVELDREMIEMIRDPLTHMIRNALDHGLENRAGRLAAGKPAEGLITVSARQSGNRIHITVEDDGKGIDPDRVAARAVTVGLLSASEAAAMPVPRRLELIFAPGLSTASAVTAISGRGVGMDVVRANVERLAGSVEVESRLGAGTCFRLEVPLTLTIIPALTVSVGELSFAISRPAIDEIVRARGAVTIERVGSGLIASVRGLRLPVAELGRVLGVEPVGPPAMLILVHTPAGRRFAIGVDAVHDHEELVIKPAAPVVMESGLFAGTTLTDSSRPMLLLDIAGVADAAGILPVATVTGTAPAPALPTLPTLLFADLDGTERAVRLTDVERIEDVARTAIVSSGGRFFLVGSALKPLTVLGAVPDGARTRVLHLRHGAAQLALLIDRALDVVEASVAMMKALSPGPVSGVLLHEGRPVELLDLAWLEANAANPDASAHQLRKPASPFPQARAA